MDMERGREMWLSVIVCENDCEKQQEKCKVDNSHVKGISAHSRVSEEILPSFLGSKSKRQEKYPETCRIL